MISWRRFLPDPRSITSFIMATLGDEIAAESRARKADLRKLEARIAEIEHRLRDR